MKCLFEFIVQIENPLNDTFQTEGGATLFATKMNQNLVVNRLAKVIALPIHHETEIKEGFEVAIDPTVLYEQAYHLTGGTQDSIFLVDKDKGYYKIKPELIVLFRENSEADWMGYMNNALFEVTKSKSEINTELVIPEYLMEEVNLNHAKLVYGNKELLEDVRPGDTLAVNGEFGVDYFLGNKQYKWHKNEDVLGVLI